MTTDKGDRSSGSIPPHIIEINRRNAEAAHERLLRVAELVQSAQSKTAIAAELGISRQMLHRLIRRAQERGML